MPDEHLKILDDWYDKLTKKYPTVGCCENNAFGFRLEDIDHAANALLPKKPEE